MTPHPEVVPFPATLLGELSQEGSMRTDLLALECAADAANVKVPPRPELHIYRRGQSVGLPAPSDPRNTVISVEIDKYDSINTYTINAALLIKLMDIKQDRVAKHVTRASALLMGGIVGSEAFIRSVPVVSVLSAGSAALALVSWMHRRRAVPDCRHRPPVSFTPAQP